MHLLENDIKNEREYKRLLIKTSPTKEFLFKTFSKLPQDIIYNHIYIPYVWGTKKQLLQYLLKSLIDFKADFLEDYLEFKFGKDFDVLETSLITRTCMEDFKNIYIKFITDKGIYHINIDTIYIGPNYIYVNFEDKLEKIHKILQNCARFKKHNTVKNQNET